MLSFKKPLNSFGAFKKSPVLCFCIVVNHLIIKTMKTQEVAKNQTVQNAKVVLPQNSNKAQKLINNVKADAVVAKATTNGQTVTVKKARAESMENLAMRLRKERASEETILSAFVLAYKLKGIQDINFIKLRLKIYLKIADKRIAATTKAK